MIDCCLPCPVTEWVYSDSELSAASGNAIASKLICLGPDFNNLGVITGWLNAIGIVCCVGLLLSYLVLPVEKSSRHYLSVGFVVSLCLIQVFPSDPPSWDHGHAE